MKTKIEAKNIDVFYGDFQALRNVNMQFEENAVTALIGPSGCGKSTYLRLFNRMNDYIDSFNMNGEIVIDGKNIYEKDVLVDEAKKRYRNGFSKTKSISKVHI